MSPILEGEVVAFQEGHVLTVPPYLTEAIKSYLKKGKTFPKSFQTGQYPVPIHCNSV